MAKCRRERKMLRRPQTIWRQMRLLLLSLTLIALLVGCAQRVSYPPFPIPNAHVKQVLDDISEEDKEVWEWLNKLLDLCQQLGTCEEED